MKIYVGEGGTAWNNGVWLRTKLYVHPLIPGISERLWLDIANSTSELKPMFGHDGSAVYADFGEYKIIRKIKGKEIVIATITEEC